MRTAAISFQSDTVGSRVTEARAVAFGVAASVLTAASTFVEVNHRTPPTPHTISNSHHQRETAVAASLLFLCPHARTLNRASRAIFVASGCFMYSTTKDHKRHSNTGCSENGASDSHFIMKGTENYETLLHTLYCFTRSE